MADRKPNDLLNEFDDAGLENLLASFSPRTPGLSQSQLMYLAGQESVRGSGHQSTAMRWIWPASTVVMVIATSVLATILAVRPEPAERVIEKIVVVERPVKDEAHGVENDDRQVEPIEVLGNDAPQERSFADNAFPNPFDAHGLSRQRAQRQQMQVLSGVGHSPFRSWETAKTVGQMRRDLMPSNGNRSPFASNAFVIFPSNSKPGGDL